MSLFEKPKCPRCGEPKTSAFICAGCTELKGFGFKESEEEKKRKKEIKKTGLF